MKKIIAFISILVLAVLLNLVQISSNDIFVTTQETLNWSLVSN